MSLAIERAPLGSDSRTAMADTRREPCSALRATVQQQRTGAGLPAALPKLSDITQQNTQYPCMCAALASIPPAYPAPLSWLLAHRNFHRSNLAHKSRWDA